MMDKVYTQQELKEMADQLLAADDKKKAGKAAAQKAEEAKPAADKALEEKLAKCPAAALLAGNEKLRELFIKGKKKGRLEPAELSEVVDPLDLDGDQMDRIYDSLADLGIDIVTEDFTNDIPEDMEPAMEEIAEIEEELVDPNTLVDSFNIDDPVRMYLKERASAARRRRTVRRMSWPISSSACSTIPRCRRRTRRAAASVSRAC